MIKELKDKCLASKADFNKSGVYIIKHNKYPDKIYIGSTIHTSNSSGFYKRWWRHYDSLSKNKHCNQKLQRLVNKYGLEGLTFKILEICTPEECITREQYWMDTLKPYYNIVKYAATTLGYRHTEEYLIRRSKPVLQYDLEGNFLKEYFGASEASIKTGIAKGTIVEACKELGNSRGHNYQWEYKNGEIPLKILPYERTTSTKILCYSLLGEFLQEYSSMLEAGTALKIHAGNISKHLSGNTSICCGYIFKYHTDNFPITIPIQRRKHKNQLEIEILNLESNEILKFYSLRQAHENGFDRTAIGKRIKKGIYNFVFKNIYQITIIK